MKIKCIILTILFCFVSSSALAWSWPWQKKIEVPPRVTIPPGETITSPGETITPRIPPGEPITPPEETPSCDVVTLLPFNVYDGYCCESYYLSNASLRLTCLQNNDRVLHAVNRVIQQEFLSSLRSVLSSLVPGYDPDATGTDWSCGNPGYTSESPETQIPGWITTIDCEINRYSVSARELSDFRTLIESHCHN